MSKNVKIAFNFLLTLLRYIDTVIEKKFMLIFVAMVNRQPWQQTLICLFLIVSSVTTKFGNKIPLAHKGYISITKVISVVT